MRSDYQEVFRKCLGQMNAYRVLIVGIVSTNYLVRQLCQYVGDKDDGSGKRNCGSSESWDDNQTVTMALATEGLLHAALLTVIFAARNLPGDLVWDAVVFSQLVTPAMTIHYAASPMGSSAASAVVESESPSFDFEKGSITERLRIVE